jgi:protein involved in polysaccharide export with SLBB domain
MNAPTLRSLALPSLVALLALVMSGCPRPTREAGPAVGSVSPPDPAPLAARLGSGDLFEVRVFQEPDLSGAFRVGPDGTIDFPFCGRVEVLGQTTGEVATRLTDCLRGGFLKNPQVAVIARDTSSKKVVVYGHVAKPGSYPYEENMSVLQAIVAAGGFAQFADQNQTNVIRTSGGRDERFRVAVQDIGMGRAANFFLRPGDIVFVPESWK